MTTIVLIVSAFACGGFLVGGCLEVFRHVLGQPHAADGWIAVAALCGGGLSALLVTAIRLPREN